MRAVVLSQDRPHLEQADVPDPEPGVGEALIRVTGCGICGSDLHVASALAPPGTILGHEIAGTVEAIGTGVDGPVWKVGDAVAVRPFFGCGRCEACARGRADHCHRFALMGMARPGGFAELVVAQADELFALPAAVTGVEQALVEPLAVARRAIRRSGIGPGDSAAVLGGGPIGQAILIWLRHLGVEDVTVTDPAATRRDLALSMGATRAIDPVGEEVEVRDLARRGALVVFECVGRPGMIDQAMSLAAVDGRVVVVGVCVQQDTFVPYTGLSKELDVRYSIYYERQDWLDAIAALDRRALALDGYVGGTVSLDDLPDRFDALLAGAEGGKVVLRP